MIAPGGHAPFLHTGRPVQEGEPLPLARLPRLKQALSLGLSSSTLSPFPSVVSKKAGLERHAKTAEPLHSKIPSLFDHTAHICSTIESNYHLDNIDFHGYTPYQRY